MKNIIILVHGMGTHKKGKIKEDFVSGVNSTLEKFKVSNFNISEKVDIYEFNYSEYLDDVRNSILENSSNIINHNGFSKLSSTGKYSTIFSSLTKYNDFVKDDNFFNTHWLDVLLYGATEQGEKIRSDFIGFFIKKYELSDFGTNLHIISHSLGTAVVHDSLNKLYRDGAILEDNILDFPLNGFEFKSLWTFANVSRLIYQLNGLTNYKDTAIKTGKICNDYYNIYNQYDPFCWIKPYRPNMLNLNTIATKIILNENPHDFFGYISNPMVVKNLIKELFYEDLNGISTAEELYAKDGINPEILKELKNELNNLDLNSVDSFKKSYELVNKIIKKIESLRT